MSNKMVIGVTGPVKGGWLAWAMTWLALKKTGAKPVRITADTIADWNRLDGLVLGGGSDIDPKNYGEVFLELVKSREAQSLADKSWSIFLFLVRGVFSVKITQPEKDHDRDELEKKLCQYAIKTQMPVLGICRGAQLINIAFGGSLYQDTGSFYTETPRIKSILPRKRVYLLENSRVGRILGVDNCRVISLLDQAIKELGRDLIISGKDKNQIVQAIEHTIHPFMVGVQWHPEYLPQIKLQQQLFKALVSASIKGKCLPLDY
ncbi:MAG: gamma-glutamyl-gamma-aminobutyrate hydrolase family protein [Desulfobacteraceae bacterium]|jgi:putative glutamine amidotransferase|nr:gamma-glutamyl-gamma-aminobutyrate hydrolase family protein [Desulfobacteraceae bacterium]